MVGCDSSKASTRLHTHTSSAADRWLTIATRVGSASALNCAASWSRSWMASGSAAGPQQMTGSVAIDFIDTDQYNVSTDVDERRAMSCCEGGCGCGCDCC